MFDIVMSFALNHWMIILAVLAAAGVAIRVMYFASNPIGALTDAWAFTIAHPKEIFVIGALLALLGFVAKQHFDTVAAEQKLAVCEANSKTLAENNAKLTQAVNDANDMVNRFEKFTSDTKTRFDSLTKGVDLSNKALATQLQSILKEKRPQTCEEAIQYLIDAQKEYAK